MRQSVRYFGFHSRHDSAELAPFITLKQFRLSLGCAGHHQFLFGASCFNCAQNKSFWQISWLWIWSGFGCTMALQRRTSCVIWPNIILVATAIHSQPSRLLVGVCPWVLYNAALISCTGGSQAPQWGRVPACLPQNSWDSHVFGN